MTPSSALASVLVDELVRGGVRDVVLSPGSRSAPLAHALLDAERAGRLRLHVRVDERSAGFLALGLAKGSGRPVPVVTTSGTAVANLHPAVLEAHHAAVPLVVLSADRPHELRGTGANQTTQQPGIFGPAVRWSFDLPAPVARPGLGPFWRSTVCRALAAATGATGPQPGPVHLDVCFREPLVPDLDPSAAPPWPDSLDGRPDGGPWVRVAPRPESVAAPIDEVARTLVVIGSTGDPRVALDAVAWARERGHPVVAEPFGPAAVREEAVPHGPLLLTATAWLDAHAPDRVLVVGRVTLSRAVGALLRRPGLRVEVVSEGGAWPDPSHVVGVVHGPDALRVGGGPAEESAHDWVGIWGEAGEALAAAVAAHPHPWPTGLAVAEAVSAKLPDGAVLVVGSSNPVRDLDLGVARSVAEEVVANRGLAGIDGLVSTAVGVALARPGTPTYALLGDLTFLHDTNGLLLGPDEPRPDLTVVVVNDDGGGIFTTLEPGAPERSDGFERVFGTPTGTDLAALCAAHDVVHTRATTAEELATEVARVPSGLRVVEVVVDRATHRQAHADLRALAARALGR
ncbi:2-succinyl-5-enolpyruvyl-6-hydroxy-3-cyclohexene-1-carboxylic-acid synthase [Oryzobacter sp. R7]|uniref:2-succinyl-5-enolpyruvyl-6-hydroxy-3- cyclohexene-1-carboxylic-acid synthase n=1 Tax=Oryzobacter faecalis TaxID=3388656 RepID=UPI00398D277E